MAHGDELLFQRTTTMSMFRAQAIALLFLGALAAAPLSTVASATSLQSCPQLSRALQELIADRAAPGTVSVQGRYLINPEDLRFMRLSREEIARISVQMVQEYLGRSIEHAQAKRLEELVQRFLDQPSANISIESLLREMGVEAQQSTELARNILQKTRSLATQLTPISPDATQARALLQQSQTQLIGTLKRHSIPHYMIRTSSGKEVPVILVNQSTYPHLQSMLEHELPFGDAVKLYPHNGTTDHGVNRVGGRIEDYFFPGEVTGDVHQTGLGGKALDSLLQRSRGENPIIETAYALSPDERRDVQLYHLVRRGGLFRIRNKWAPAKEAYNGKTAILERGQEICYTFGSGLCSIEHSRNMYDYLMRMGLSNPDEFLKKPQVQKFLNTVYDDLLALPINSPAVRNNPAEQEKILHDWMLHQNPKYHEMLRGLFPASIRSDEDFVRFFNYLVGIDISRRYAGITHDLQLFDPVTALLPHNDIDVHNRSAWPTFIQADRKRVAAIFVYDTGTQSAADFRNRNYQGAYYVMPPGQAPTRRELE